MSDFVFWLFMSLLALTAVTGTVGAIWGAYDKSTDEIPSETPEIGTSTAYFNAGIAIENTFERMIENIERERIENAKADVSKAWLEGGMDL